jgi:hypothetical protein
MAAQPASPAGSLSGLLGVTLEDPLWAARAQVLHDLQVRGAADPESVSALEEAVARRRWWVSQWERGGEFVAGLLAQDVQDALLDRTQRWPTCERCADGDQSLYIVPELGPDPHWVCSSCGAVIAALGRL